MDSRKFLFCCKILRVRQNIDWMLAGLDQLISCRVRSDLVIRIYRICRYLRSSSYSGHAILYIIYIPRLAANLVHLETSVFIWISTIIHSFDSSGVCFLRSTSVSWRLCRRWGAQGWLHRQNLDAGTRIFSKALLSLQFLNLWRHVRKKKQLPPYF